MRLRHLVRLTAAALLFAVPVSGFVQQTGQAQAAGRPAGVGMPGGFGYTHGPSTLPDQAAGIARNGGVGMPGGRSSTIAADARRDHARELWRANRELLDFDPHDQLIVRGQIAGLVSSAEAMAAVQAAGIVARSQSPLDGPGAMLAVLEPPRGMSMRKALRVLREVDADGAYDYNHIYFESAAASAQPGTEAPAATAAHESAAGAARASRRIGLIDSGVAASHPALRASAVHNHGCNGNLAPSAHGTAVASLLLGGPGRSQNTDVPMELYAADVYCGAPAGGSVDALIDAFAWLMRERVPVINVSLVGPANALLERVVALAVARGHLVVAAVGNDGPAAPPLYPAAYPAVIAVTGVDQSDKVLIEASRGKHVDFAAPGADVLAASLPAGAAQERGTSFAAPIVAYLLAQRLEQPDPARAQLAVQSLAATAIDLGARGFDPVYGNGLVGADLRGAAVPAASAR